MNLNNINAEMTPIEEKEPDYDRPNGSRWIIGVADDGTVVILSIPHVHYSFTDAASTAEEFGLPESVDDAPGVYEWICNLDVNTDWESGFIDDWCFYPTETKLLYSWDDGKVNKSGNEEA